MGNLYYNVLGNTGSLINDGPFHSIHSTYWSATEYAFNAVDVWTFNMHGGGQNTTNRTASHYAWAVHDGDIGAVPIPSAVWLFGSGLITLIGFTRRKGNA